jgi:hypothetical protein
MSNTSLVGDITSTQITDAWFHGCGITNYFRELKPAMADAYNDMGKKIRWCLFVEPVNIYRGSTVRVEAVLVNNDALKPGKYPVRLQVIGPNMTQVFDRSITIEISGRANRPEQPFAQSVFSDDLKIDGPSGKYKFLSTFQWGAAAGGGEAEFYVDDAAEMPTVTTKLCFGERTRDWQVGFRNRDFMFEVSRPRSRFSEK